MVIGAGAVASGAVGALPLAIGGGTTTVSAELAQSYKVRASVDQNLAQSYNVRAYVSQDLPQSYDVQEAGAVSNSLSQTYKVRATVSQDLGQTYRVRSAVDQALAQTYKVRTYVSGTVVGAYDVLTASQVYSALGQSYVVRAYVDQELAQSYRVLEELSLSDADLDAIAARVWDTELETGYTAAQMMRIMLAALAGKRSGLGTATEQYMGLDGTTPRVIFTPSDAAGNGTTVVDGS